PRVSAADVGRCVFFSSRRRHTRSKRDWSSDVCSSDLDLGGDESPLSMKADFLLSLCELVVGGKEGLQPIEKTVIDRCVRLVYREIGRASCRERVARSQGGRAVRGGAGGGRVARGARRG